MAALTPDQVKSLDQARLRLLALHTSLVALRSEITTQSQLPSWYLSPYSDNPREATVADHVQAISANSR